MDLIEDGWRKGKGIFLIESDRFSMGREKELEREIKELEAQLRDREDSLPAHSVRPQQILVIEELETAIEVKKKELEELRRKK